MSGYDTQFANPPKTSSASFQSAIRYATNVNIHKVSTLNGSFIKLLMAEHEHLHSAISYGVL